MTIACSMFKLSPYVTAKPAIPRKKKRSKICAHNMELKIEVKRNFKIFKALTWINHSLWHGYQENQGKGKCET